ncbi:PQQ-dependent sugar dehydrogenase [Mucilaginibacter sp.]|uniref:PQQ-dependent sugar dehydrogenase n=1 Tax=Mucilaginibacter sp. TaxID=1882438 RepID=UPI0025DAD248|nr:PQQ-dependent sugar dehydrogenase [Mucilaginibacter sp.]
MKKTLMILGLLAIPVLFICSQRRGHQAGDDKGYVIDTLASNLVVPWQIVFLPDKSLLFTERPGRVRLFRNGKLRDKPILVVHDIPLRNKTGMLGMAIHPNFLQNHFVYLAHDYGTADAMNLKVVRYEFMNDTLINPKIIIDGLPANQNHTGCRLVFGPDHKLWVTTGDADQPIRAQDLKYYNGKVLRINDDGTIPTDNPFFKNDTAKKEIWTYGHRNVQGLVFEPGTGTLFNTEHGPTGGDEINIDKKGDNYGWPIIHHREKHEGMHSPLAEFTPSIAPGEALFYTAGAFPQLKNNLLIACLRGEGILRVTLHHDTVASEEMLLKNTYGRIRSIATGSDGYIYFSTSQEDPVEGKHRPGFDMLLRMRPAGSRNTDIAGQKLMTTAPQNTKPIAARTGAALFQQLCASCHGDRLQGKMGSTPNLAAGKFLHGADKASINRNITNGIMNKGMPSWNGAISKADISRLTEYIYAHNRKHSIKKTSH